MTTFLESIRPRPKPKFFIKTEKNKIVYVGTEYSEGHIEITRREYIDIRSNGLDHYEYTNNKLSVKSFRSTNRPIHNELKSTTENGYNFLSGDPFWVITHKESDTGIYSWQKK